MRSAFSRFLSTIALCFLCLMPGVLRGASGSTAVEIERVPDGGIQPQVAVGADGTVHLLYYKGESRAGDVFYVHSAANERHWSDPVRVNSQPGSVIAAGTIRGAQMALGKGDRVHVVWNGSGSAEPKGPDGELPLLYARLSDDSRTFEEQRNVVTSAYGLDGGGCVAADREGHVYVAWHGRGDEPGEEHRRVYIARSADDGETFSPEQPVDADRAGACGCCGMRGTAAPDGRVMFLYRSAEEGVNRDIYLLSSDDLGRTFHSNRLDRWRIDACPMSSAAFAHTSSGTWGAWETREHVFFAPLDGPAAIAVRPRAASPESSKQKHPAFAVNGSNEVLLVWTEGTGWQRGGSFAWQLYDRRGRATSTRGRHPGIPVWSFSAAYARPDGSFVILY
jgi:hypothetical protein